MAEHDALRQAPGAGGVDDTRRIVACRTIGHFDDIGMALLALFDDVVHMQNPEAELLGEFGRVHGDDEFQLRGIQGGGQQLLSQFPGRHDGALRSAVVQDVQVVVGGVGGVGGDRDGPDGHDRHVGDQPGRAVFRYQHHPVAFFHALRQ